MTYTDLRDEPKGQATCMDARRGKDTSILQAGEAAGRLPFATFATGREDRLAAFASDAVNRSEVPRTACFGR